jgi:hypothetical protein
MVAEQDQRALALAVQELAENVARLTAAVDRLERAVCEANGGWPPRLETKGDAVCRR